MIKAILFDLDETLIALDTTHFATYLAKALVKTTLRRFPDRDPEAVGQGFAGAIRAVAENYDPTLSNGQVYTETLSRATGLTPAELGALAELFYSSDYQAYASSVAMTPGADSVLRRAFDKGLAVVIATAPLFPSAVILDRLAWARLDTTLPFALITGIEEMHFPKASPYYYEEILARVGVEADEAIMVGNSLTDDIRPAQQAGLNTFWIADHAPEGCQPEGYGTLVDFDRKLADDWLLTLEPRPRTADQLFPRLTANVAAAFGLIQAMNPEFWRMRPDPKEWSPLEIICHLRDSERHTQRPRLIRILNETDPFLTPPKTPPGPGESDLTDEDGETALQQWWEERCTTLEFLRRLDDSDFSRPARHSIFGPTTLLEMAHFTARHDRLHINQLCQTIGRCRDV